MRFWGTVALRCVNSEELTPLERMTANEWGIEPAVSARSGQSRALFKWKIMGVDSTKMGEQVAH